MSWNPMPDPPVWGYNHSYNHFYELDTFGIDTIERYTRVPMSDRGYPPDDVASIEPSSSHSAPGRGDTTRVPHSSRTRCPAPRVPISSASFPSQNLGVGSALEHSVAQSDSSPLAPLLGTSPLPPVHDADHVIARIPPSTAPRTSLIGVPLSGSSIDTSSCSVRNAIFMLLSLAYDCSLVIDYATDHGIDSFDVYTQWPCLLSMSLDATSMYAYTSLPLFHRRLVKLLAVRDRLVFSGKVWSAMAKGDPYAETYGIRRDWTLQAVVKRFKRALKGIIKIVPSSFDPSPDVFKLAIAGESNFFRTRILDIFGLAPNPSTAGDFDELLPRERCSILRDVILGTLYRLAGPSTDEHGRELTLWSRSQSICPPGRRFRKVHDTNIVLLRDILFDMRPGAASLSPKSVLHLLHPVLKESNLTNAELYLPSQKLDKLVVLLGTLRYLHEMSWENRMERECQGIRTMLQPYSMVDSSSLIRDPGPVHDPIPQAGQTSLRRARHRSATDL